MTNIVHNVILEMLVSSAGEASRDIMVYSNTEAILECGEITNPEVIISRMSLTTEWVGKLLPGEKWMK